MQVAIAMNDEGMGLIFHEQRSQGCDRTRRCFVYQCHV